MDLERIERIKKLVIIALFSDDALLETLVLKGGNAIDLIHGVAMRASIDLDFSIEADLPNTDVQSMRQRFEQLLNETLRPAGFCAFDVTFDRRPPEVTPDLEDFWGGYCLEFKVTSPDKFEQLEDQPRSVRTGAESIAPGHRKTLRVDISRYERCQSKQARDLDGYRIYVYTPEMIVCEKLRAICQQMPEYRKIVKSRPGAARARDFFDIHTLVEAFGLDLATEANPDLLRRTFAAKRVPLALLREIGGQREFHRADFAAVRATVKPGVAVRDFDDYFDYVVKLVAPLQSLGIE